LKEFENRMLRRIFGAKRDEATGDWRKLHKEQLHNLYSSPNIIRMIKSRRKRWTGHVARMGEEQHKEEEEKKKKKNACINLVGKPRET
jgi:hypothetical protein